MPDWLSREQESWIATRLGLERSSPAFQAALQQAWERISAATGLILGTSIVDQAYADVHAPTLAISIPMDATAVELVTPEVEGELMIEDGLLYRVVDGRREPWPEGFYTFRVTRGLSEAPPEVLDALTLMTQLILQPPDPDKSRLDNPGFGAGGGTRASLTGVPEVDQLLGRWLSRPYGEAL